MRYWSVSILFLLLLSSALATAGRKAPPDLVTILQRGKHSPVNGVVTLRKEPFRIVIALQRDTGVLLNASLSRQLYDRSRKNSPLGDKPPLGTASGMAESLNNPDKELWLSDKGSHYLFAKGAKEHRFDRVVFSKAGFVGHRTVAKIVQLDKKKKAVDLGQWSKDIYLVFRAVHYDAKKQAHIERWRFALRLRFR